MKLQTTVNVYGQFTYNWFMYLVPKRRLRLFLKRKILETK